MNKIAVLGGAFDPPHNAHIAIAEKAAELYGYEKVVILPSANPPHKRTVGATNHRYNMAKLAFSSEKFEVCDLEIKSQGYGYTVETIPKLKKLLGQDFDFIIGGDSIRDFRKWYRYEDILSLVNIVVAVRDCDMDSVSKAIYYLDELPKKGIYVMEYMPDSVSSSSIRLLRELGQNIGNFVPKSVAEYIYGNNLYSDFDAMREKLRETISAERYNHTIGVVKFAMQYQSKLGLKYEQVFMASLLHDCAKYNCDYNGLDISKDSIGTPVAHAFAGACFAKEIYGVNDTEVLDAIYYHCTAKADMSKLAILVFCADMLEEGRNFENVAALRDAFSKDYLQGFKQCLTESYNHVIRSGGNMYELTEQAISFYNNN